MIAVVVRIEHRAPGNSPDGAGGTMMDGEIISAQSHPAEVALLARLHPKLEAVMKEVAQEQSAENGVPYVDLKQRKN